MPNRTPPCQGSGAGRTRPWPLCAPPAPRDPEPPPAPAFLTPRNRRACELPKAPPKIPGAPEPPPPPPHGRGPGGSSGAAPGAPPGGGNRGRFPAAPGGGGAAAPGCHFTGTKRRRSGQVRGSGTGTGGAGGCPGGSFPSAHRGGLREPRGLRRERSERARFPEPHRAGGRRRGLLPGLRGRLGGEGVGGQTPGPPPSKNQQKIPQNCAGTALPPSGRGPRGCAPMAGRGRGSPGRAGAAPAPNGGVPGGALQLPLLLGLPATPAQGFWGCAELGAEWRYPKRKPRAPPGGPRWGLGPKRRAWDHRFLGRGDETPGPQLGPDTPAPLPPAPGLGFPRRVQVPPRCIPLRRCPPGGSPLSFWGFAFVGWRRAALCSPGVVEQRQELGGLRRAPALPPSQPPRRGSPPSSGSVLAFLPGPTKPSRRWFGSERTCGKAKPEGVLERPTARRRAGT